MQIVVLEQKKEAAEKIDDKHKTSSVHLFTIETTRESDAYEKPKAEGALIEEIQVVYLFSRKSHFSMFGVILDLLSLSPVLVLGTRFLIEAMIKTSWIFLFKQERISCLLDVAKLHINRALIFVLYLHSLKARVPQCSRPLWCQLPLY